MTWGWIALGVGIGLLIGLAVLVKVLSDFFSPFDPAKR